MLLRVANLKGVPPRSIGDIFIISFKGLGNSINFLAYCLSYCRMDSMARDKCKDL